MNNMVRSMDDESYFVETAKSEYFKIYLKSIWCIRESEELDQINLYFMTGLKSEVLSAFPYICF